MIRIKGTFCLTLDLSLIHTWMAFATTEHNDKKILKKIKSMYLTVCSHFGRQTFCK